MGRKRSITLFTTLSSAWGVVYGLVGPYYVLYISRISGTAEKLGIAFSIMILVQSAACYVVGKYSDVLGRKPFLLMTGLLDAAVLLCFTIADRPWHVYLLQALLGITNATSLTVRTSILGDLTTTTNRGMDIGKYNAIVGVFSGVGVAVGGYIATIFGLQAIFYAGAAAIVLSTVMLFFFPEPREDTVG